MTHPAPRRLLLVAADATPRGTTAPIRRYRLGQVLMGAQELIGMRDETGPWAERDARRANPRLKSPPT